MPAVKQFDTYVKKVNPSWSPDLYTLFGWASAEMFVQALKAAGPQSDPGFRHGAAQEDHELQRRRALRPARIPAAKTLTPCFLMAGIKNGKFVRELPTGGGFDCNAKLYNASGVTG